MRTKTRLLINSHQSNRTFFEVRTPVSYCWFLIKNQLAVNFSRSIKGGWSVLYLLSDYKWRCFNLRRFWILRSTSFNYLLCLRPLIPPWFFSPLYETLIIFLGWLEGGYFGRRHARIDDDRSLCGHHFPRVLRSWRRFASSHQKLWRRKAQLLQVSIHP